MDHLHRRRGGRHRRRQPGFWIGHKGGYRLVKRYGSKIRLDERKLKVGRYVFDRHGTKVVFFGRFVSILRTYAAFLAGTSKMRWRRFLPANAAGGIVWAAIYTFAAYQAGTTLRHLSGTIDLALGVAAVVVIVVVLIAVRHSTNRLGSGRKLPRRHNAHRCSSLG